MAISYVSGAAAATTTVTMPSHTTGDLILCFAFRDGNTSTPALPAGWTNLSTYSGTSCSARLGYKYAASGSETTGTWTSATGVTVQVYRGAYIMWRGKTSGTGSSNSITHPDATPYLGDLWSVRFCGHRTATNLTTNTPSGYTARAGVATECRGMDSNGYLTASTGTQSQSVSASSGWIAVQVQLAEIGANALSTFQDSFSSGSSPDSAKWTTTSGTSGVANITSNQLFISTTNNVASYGGVAAKKWYSLTGQTFPFQIGTVSHSGGGSFFAGVGSSSYGMGWGFTAGGLITPVMDLGANLVTQAVGASTRTHTAGDWYRVRESSGTVYWDYSSDGLSWTNLYSRSLTSLASDWTVTTSDFTAVFPAVSIAHYGSGYTSSWYVDNVGGVESTSNTGLFFRMF